MLGIVVSRADEASAHIGEQLRAVTEWTATNDSRPDADGGGTVYRTEGAVLREFDDRHLDLDSVAEVFADPSLLAFASKHAGETGELLTAHHTGNFGVADYGGEAGQFARACPNAHRAVIEALTAHAPEGYDVGMECTHHGPTAVGVPSMFVEVGSAEPQWRDPDAARAAAQAILATRDTAADAPRENGSRRQLVGLGGGHYAPRFERVVRETDWAVGHIGADWSLDALDAWADDADDRQAVVSRAFDASGADYALLEGDRPELVDAIESLGHRAVGETFVRESSGVPLSLVERLEDVVHSVDDGLRFGDRATGEPPAWHVIDPPAELLSEARAIDADAVRGWVDAETLAYGTEQNGTVLTGPLVVPETTARESVISMLADVLRRRYDAVSREGGELVAREEAFDPSLARAADVPEGPKFGKLSSGEPIELDGETVTPERFYRERIRRFTL